MFAGLRLVTSEEGVKVKRELANMLEATAG